MQKISFDNRIRGRERRLFSIIDSIDKDRAQLDVALRHILRGSFRLFTHSYSDNSRS